MHDASEPFAPLIALVAFAGLALFDWFMTARTVLGSFIEGQRKAMQLDEDEQAYREWETTDCALSDRPPVPLRSESAG